MGKPSNSGSGKKSKRIKLNIKYKVKSKVAACNRKIRKESKKMKALGLFKKKSKEPSLPNLYPFKAKIMESLERKKLEEDQLKNLERLQKKQKIIPNMEAIAEKYENEFQMEDEESKYLDAEVLRSLPKENKKFYKELYKVLESSDIILIVLDARHPMECRSKLLESKILAMPGEKKIILVLNKIDLIPQDNADAWLKFLRREYATIIFKANTQNQSSHLGNSKIYKKSLMDKPDLIQSLVSSSKGVGTENLMDLIKNYSKKDGIIQSVTVGVIGFPNVGKSSIINSLNRAKAAAVSSTPGYTKNIQEIQLESKVKILDSPGVIFASSNETDKLSTMNIMKVEQIKDYSKAVETVLSKVNKDDILLLYKIPDYQNVTGFLANVAVSRGKLQKKGIVDLEAAARIVLNDWNSGRIKYYSLVPTKDNEMQIE